MLLLSACVEYSHLHGDHTHIMACLFSVNALIDGIHYASNLVPKVIRNKQTFEKMKMHHMKVPNSITKYVPFMTASFYYFLRRSPCLSESVLNNCSCKLVPSYRQTSVVNTSHQSHLWSCLIQMNLYLESGQEQPNSQRQEWFQFCL